ncbi:MAG: DsbA family protein [Patescibacteria group bacterium]|nr:DsbA family protein [Patescibacteria group bacterium]
MNKKTSFLIIILLIVAAFLAGSTAAKIKYGEGPFDYSQGKQEEQTPTQGAVPTTPPFEPKKSAKPEVKFFVMSFCPYGNQAEAGLEPVYQLLKNKVTWSPRYIVSDKKSSCEQNCPYKVYNDQAKTRCEAAIKQGQIKDLETCKTYFPYTSADDCLQKECASLKAGEFSSLHGEQELNQDVREIVAFNQGNLDKWWKFVSTINNKCTSSNADSCWQAVATEAGLSSTRIEAAAKAQRKSLLTKEAAEGTKYKASSSPSVFINETVYNGGRSPEDYKKAICSAFANPPAECNQTLDQNGATTSGGCN